MSSNTQTPAANGIDAPSKTVELAIDLPHSPGSKVNLHLTILANSILLFLSSSTPESSQGAAGMGSLVYAIPDRYNPTQPMSTALYNTPSTLDFTTRMAKLLARKLSKPCYVGSSVNLTGGAGGGSVEEEMEAFRGVVDAVVGQVQR
ncbi:unnamed protein product [Zymoseptoria tritici ST99CH_3D1]|nr:unnamed protein product [Zymoseptoria tritici ST99CH_3D1]